MILSDTPRCRKDAIVSLHAGLDRIGKDEQSEKRHLRFMLLVDPAGVAQYPDRRPRAS